MLICILGMLTYLTTGSKVFYIQSQFGPPHTSQQSKHSFTNPKLSCVTGIMQLSNHKLAWATRPWNHMLIFLQFWYMIHKQQTMQFTKAKRAIITTGLITCFLHSSIERVLWSLVHHSKPARFNSKHVHLGLVRVRDATNTWQHSDDTRQFVDGNGDEYN